MKKDSPQFEQESSPQGSLDWLAFRYVAGELDPDDRIAFEDRLADDQQACEAVASAVELCELSYSAIGKMELASNQTTSLAAPFHSRLQMWKPVLVLAGAIALLVTGGIFYFLGDSNNAGDQSADADSVAVAWAEIVTDEADLDEVELNEVDFESDLVDFEDASWMLVALSDLDEIEGGFRE